MTRALVAQRAGHEFQARHFWRNAASLLDPQSPIVRVGFEIGPRSLDDLCIDYAPGRGPGDTRGRPLQRVRVQCKWHVSPGSYGYEDLTNPSFINASTRSFLQRAHDAWRAESNGSEGGVRYEFLTNWQLLRNDPLHRLVSTGSGAIRPERLSEGKTDRSQSGEVRRLWREHLGIDDEELIRFCTSLAFRNATTTLDECRASLDPIFAIVGLKRVPAHRTTFLYDALPYAWLDQGEHDFDEASLRARCLSEGLLGPAVGRRRVYGVKSFEHPLDRLEHRCDEVLDLVPAFDQRYIRSDADWRTHLHPRLESFLQRIARSDDDLSLVLDAHVTLAFAAGAILDVKSGKRIELEQRTAGRSFWSVDDGEAGTVRPAPKLFFESLAAEGADFAVAIGMTHDIAADVRRYVEATLPSAGNLLNVRPDSGSGARSVLSGEHAYEIVDKVVDAVRARSAVGDAERVVHLFVASPNALTFFLGQRHRALGRVALYEFDFDGARGGSYTRSVVLPLA